MKTLEHVLEIAGFSLCREEVEECVREDWVKPDPHAEHGHFEDIDIARLQLIGELRHRLGVNNEAIPLILSLLDQLHDSRQRVQRLVQAIERQPRHLQAEIFALLVEE